MDYAEQPSSAYVQVVETTQKTTKEYSLDTSSAEIAKCIQDIQTSLADGFQWQDIGPIIKSTCDLAQTFYQLSLEDKRATVQKILETAFHKIKIPYVPHFLSDPLFSSVMYPLIYIFLPDPSTTYTQPESLSASPTYDDIKTFAKNTAESFSNKLSFIDLGKAIQKSEAFAKSYSTLTPKSKAYIAKSAIDLIIEYTDTPILPDGLSDPIFRDLAHGVIDAKFIK